MQPRQTILAATLALAMGLCASARPAAALDAREILLRSLTPEDTTYVGEQVVEGQGAPKAPRRRAVQRVYRRGNTLRIDYPNGQVMFDDGAAMLMYHPRQGAVERSPSALAPARVAAQRRLLSRPAVRLTQLPDETVAGRSAYVIAAQLPDGTERRVWIDRETFLQLRQDIMRPQGRLSTYFVSIDLGATPPAEKLAFSPPPGVDVVEAGAGRPIPALEATRIAQAWGGLLQPKTLPAGYRFRNFYRQRLKGREVLVAVYQGPGSQTLSFFQGPAIGMAPMTAQRKNVRVLAGRKGSADVMILGSLPEEDLQRMMDSVE
jgi:outer membrane lipoprotein-sorting protein